MISDKNLPFYFKDFPYSKVCFTVALGQLANHILLKRIHLIPKWRPINYSFVCMLISRLCFVKMYRKSKRILK